MIDLEAKVITAETPDIIGQYILFSHVLDEQIKRCGPTREAAQEAIRICRDQGVLLDYLKEEEKEVVDIMIMLFDQEYAVQQYGKSERSEGRMEGRVEGRVEGRIITLLNLVKRGLLPIKDAADEAKMSQSDFEALLNSPEAFAT